VDRLNQIASGFTQAKILLAAAELRLFDAVAKVLDALTAMELLDKRDGVYRLRAEYEPWLREDSPTCFPALLRHRNHMFRHWARLEQQVTGEAQPPDESDRSVLSDAEMNDNFIRAMYAVGHERAEDVAARIDLDGVHTVADLGGGPGHYLVEIARRSERIELYLVDLPLTLETAARILSDSPFGERIHRVAWNFYDDPPPPELPPLDLVFISQVLHAESAERNRVLLRSLVPLLAPGGRVIVQENVVAADRTAPFDAALFAVNMLAMTAEGRTYTEEEILSWGRDAGLEPGGTERIDDRATLITLRR